MTYYIVDHSTDPYWNLAAEEYLLKKMTLPIFRLWRNRPSIIVGLHQNAIAEINREFVKQQNIAVVRRLSGGGAVFHDMGNVNFTFIDKRVEGESTATMFRRFTRPILEALHSLGVAAEFKGRNDLVIEEKKFSGNAVALYKERVLQHGTLLFSSSISDLSNALANRAENFKGRAVQSNRSRVTNIEEHLKEPLSVEQFISYLESYVTERSEGRFKRYLYSAEDLAEIARLTMEKYSRESWNYGSSPKYSYSKVERFDWGLVELYMTVKERIIEEIQFFGTYFFLAESVELEKLLVGTPHSREAIKERVKKINLSSYFSSITEEEFLSLF